MPSRCLTSQTPIAIRMPRKPNGMARLRAWFKEQGWRPFPFQREAWAAFARGEDGLVHVPTGAGKTYAAYLAALAQCIDEPPQGIAIVYVTPLRALARDIELALTAPVTALGLDLRVESRTGDTPSALRQRQRTRLPHVLITTPESLTVLLSYDEAARAFVSLRVVIVDEWHELISSKRGTQTELALARLRRMAPGLRTWALSATLRDPALAAQCVVGTGRPYTVVTAALAREVRLETMVPDRIERFPWAGRLGLAMLPRVLELLADGRSTLLFTNTRSQAERWYQAIIDARPEWQGHVALHHGSIDREERARVEGGLKSGAIRAVVATSSLDLGVDFSPVDRVLQIGSPKGIARLMQRAGRSAHRPGETARVHGVPTHALELIEFSAARVALAARHIEERLPLEQPLDVLVQHLVTCALGGGFVAECLYEEVREAWAYRALSREAFAWALAMVEHGGATLSAYDQHHRITAEDGVYRGSNARIARFHRLGIGTITADATMEIRFLRGARIGTIEEDFIARLRPGDRFVFAGRSLEFVTVRELVAYVRKSAVVPSLTPIWAGSRFPMSTSLGEGVRAELDRAARGEWDGASPELLAARPVLDEQARLSALPRADDLLVERWASRAGHHLFLYPFEGRRAHQALAALLALRLGRRTPGTFSLTVNDYGIELLGDRDVSDEELRDPAVLTSHGVEEDLTESVNLGELAKRQFRDIARVAGLVFAGYPGGGKGARQVQMSASLVFDVFVRYDPDNLLLAQARREVFEQQFELSRLVRALERLAGSRTRVTRIHHPTPLAFPLVIDRLGSRLSTDALVSRVQKMIASWVEEDAPRVTG